MFVLYSYLSSCSRFFCFNDTATTEIYTYCHTLSLHDALPISGPSRVQLRDNFMVTPGRSRIRFADNVNAKPGEYLPSVQTNVWVDLNTRTGRPERQARGGNVRVAGLTRIEDLECAALVRRNSKLPKAA